MISKMKKKKFKIVVVKFFWLKALSNNTIIYGQINQTITKIYDFNSNEYEYAR